MAVRRAVNPKKLRPYTEPPRARRQLIPDAPDSGATAFLVVALLWLAVATGIGTLWVGTLLFPQQLLLALDLGVELPFVGALSIDVSQATVESGFTNALVYGWLSNAAFAAILFITPRVTGARLAGDSLAFGGMLAWNLGVASGMGAIYVPALSSDGPLAEFPLPVDGLLLLGALVVTAVFFRTLLNVERRLPYVSIWFFGVALLAFMGLYALGAGALVLNLDATAHALLTAFVARGIATYWILGVALGTLFYVVPRATANPLSSSGMGMLAWLLWAGLAGLSALGALVDTSVPFAITTIGNAGTMLLVAPVFLAVAALALTIQGRWTLVFGTGTVGFAAVSMAFLLATTMFEAIGALRSVQDLVRGTQWSMGVWLFAWLGGATFAHFALADHAAPRLLRRDWRGGPAVDAQLWATLTGVTLAGVSLIGAGIAHGSLIREAAAPEEIQATLTWFYLSAGAGMGLAALGGLCALVAVFLMYTTARRAEYEIAVESSPAGGAAAGAPAAR